MNALKQAQEAYDNQLPHEGVELTDEQVSDIREITLRLIESEDDDFRGLRFDYFLQDNHDRIRSALIAREKGIDLSGQCFSGLFNDFLEVVKDEYIVMLDEYEKEARADAQIQQMESDHEYGISFNC